MDKITKLSQAIRYGSTFIREDKMFCSPDRKGGCAIGTAYLAMIGEIGTGAKYSWEWFEILSKRFNVPLSILHETSNNHWKNKMNRAECADWLEAQGY